MRVQKISVLTLVAVAAGLSLTACGGTGTSAASGATGTSGSISGTTSASSDTGAPDSGQADSGQPDSGQAGSATTGSAGGSTNGSSLADGSGAGSGSAVSSGSGSGSAASTGSGSGASAGRTCRTANLSFTTSGGMAEGEILVNMKNTGSASCTMHGFPGVDLKGRDGTVSATRSSLNAPDVTVAPGQETRFTLHYPPNETGGSGVTFTGMVVTPPNETRSRTLSQSINIPANSNSAPTITVDPVGAGK